MPTDPLTAPTTAEELTTAFLDEVVDLTGIWPDGSYRRHFLERIAAIEAAARAEAVNPWREAAEALADFLTDTTITWDGGSVPADQASLVIGLRALLTTPEAKP